MGHVCLKTSAMKTFDTGVKLYLPKPQTIGSNTTCWIISRGQNWGDLTRMRTEPNPHKGMTPPSTQNLKALGLWVFFLIYCSTFSLLLNVGLRLTLEYLNTKEN